MPRRPAKEAGARFPQTMPAWVFAQSRRARVPESLRSFGAGGVALLAEEEEDEDDDVDEPAVDAADGATAPAAPFFLGSCHPPWRLFERLVDCFTR